MASREATPPPIIGKAGNLTVFITPSPSPKRNPNPNPSTASSPSPSPSPSPRAALSASCPSPILNLTPSPRESPVSKTKPAGSPVKEKKAFVVAPPPPPPVQVPPKQYEKGKDVNSHGSAFGFFWDAIARVQEAHSSLDEYLANWFGLDQSKYQWALNDYYETNTKDMESIKGSKPKDVISKGQAV